MTESSVLRRTEYRGHAIEIRGLGQTHLDGGRVRYQSAQTFVDGRAVGGEHAGQAEGTLDAWVRDATARIDAMPRF